MESTMETLVIAVALATVAIPALTEAATASQTWHLPVSKVMATARYAALIGLVGMIVALTGAIVGESANAAGYSRRDDAPTAYNTQANPHYGFGPRVRVQPTDVISGDRMIGRDPDPFIRGQILRNYR
jgi:hypothetical protein